MATEGVEATSSEVLGIQLDMPRSCSVWTVPGTEAAKSTTGTTLVKVEDGTTLVKVEDQYVFDLLAARAARTRTFPMFTYDSIPSTVSPATRVKLAAAFGMMAASFKELRAAQDEVLQQYAEEGTAYVVV